MNRNERLPGHWLELHMVPADQGAGLGPALGWLAGALASGGSLWPWPHLGQLLLGFFLISAAWGRLWTLFGQEVSHGTPDNNPKSAENPGFRLPYTTSNSLSAEWAGALGQFWRLWQAFVAEQRRWVVEIIGLTALLLIVSGLWGKSAFLAGVVGVALLVLRRLVLFWPRADTPAKPALRLILCLFGGLAWPWWLGHTAWAPLTADSLLLSLLWGLAYAGWAELSDHRVTRSALLQTDLAQGIVILFFLLSHRPLLGGALVLTLLGQLLLQAGFSRAERQERIAGGTWPFAAAGLILSGLALGKWV